MDEIKTLTVDELIALLTKFPHDTKVYMSRDSEGNGFGTISNSEMAREYHVEDKSLALFPMQEYIEFDAIFPKTWEEM